MSTPAVRASGPSPASPTRRRARATATRPGPAPTVAAPPPDAAAVFDLDRTLIAGASGPVFQRALRAAGLLPERDVPLTDVLSGVLAGVYGALGENAVVMQLARFVARTARGWEVGAVDAAATAAADVLLDRVLPFVRDVLAWHRDEGRLVVVATTSPEPLVAPFARALGADAVVATRWAQEGGRYTGGLDGPFVWGRAKRDAVGAWALERDISLRACWAYSDSYFDTPLLAAVGHPVAVNPDPRLAVVARLRGWPVRHFDVSPGVVKVAGRELQAWARPFVRLGLLPNARFEIHGLEHVPASGGAIVCANHRSYFDVLTLAVMLARAGRTARFLGKREVFDAPIVGDVARALGGIRVDRGTGSDQPLRAAAAALRAGELVAVLPQGTIPRGPAFFEPELRGRWGAARLAALSHAPVIPVGLWGTERVWPRNSRLPNLNPLAAPSVTVRVGPPVTLGYDDPEADTGRIMGAIAGLLPPEARERRAPTDDDLRRTYPPGYRGDPAHEAERRPGSD